MTALPSILLAQCCGGGDGGGSGVSTGEYAQAIILCVVVALLLLARLIWNKKGASTMSKLGKIAIVVVLAIAVIVVVAMKKNDNAAVPGQPTTQRAGIPRLVDLGSTTCQPCQLMAPLLEELKKEYAGKLQVDFIDVYVNPEAKAQYKINLFPTQIFYDATGKEIDRNIGFISKEDILARWKAKGITFVSPSCPASSAPADTPAVKSGST